MLKKGNNPLGFSIVGGSDHASHPFGMDEPGIFISKVSAKLKYHLDSRTGLEKSPDRSSGRGKLIFFLSRQLFNTIFISWNGNVQSLWYQSKELKSKSCDWMFFPINSHSDLGRVVFFSLCFHKWAQRSGARVELGHAWQQRRKLHPVGGRVFNRFLYGEAPPRGPTPYPFIYNFYEKGAPFVYLLLTNGCLFTYLVWNFASLLTAVDALNFKWESFAKKKKIVFSTF